jgi:hypothetical protein
MIRYALSCDHGHAFEAWFGSSSDYEDQEARGLVECPLCASRTVRKQIMAPAVIGTKADKTEAGPAEVLAALPTPDAAPPMLAEIIEKVRDYVVSNCEDVGTSFAKVARDIHEGREEERGIYGQASPKEVRDLIEDGVPIAPLPFSTTPRDKLN